MMVSYDMKWARVYVFQAVIYGALLFAGAASLVAQEREPIQLSLGQALELAEGSSPALRRATNATLINGSEMRSTWAEQLLPRAQLTLFNTAFTGNLQRRALDNFGNPIANPGAEWNYFSQTSHSLGLSWSVQGASLFQSHERQQLTNEDRDVALLRARTDVEIEVQRLYIDAMEQKALTRAEEELVAARQIDLEVAERLFSLALRTRVDILNAELALEQQALTLQQQEATYQRALLALRTAMGFTDDRPLEVGDEELPLFDPSGFDAAALISRALEVNPALLQSDVQLRSAELTLSERKTAWWPEVRFGLDVYRQSYEPETEALFDPSIGTDLESRFFVGFSIPVLNGLFRQRAQQQQASIDLRNQRERDREARLQLDEAIRGSLLELENQWASAQLSDRSSEIAQEALALAREEYRLGTRSFEELRSAFQQEADTRRQVITARHAFVDALLTLEEAVGASVRGEAGTGASGEGS
jgi:outer membrane protein